MSRRLVKYDSYFISLPKTGGNCHGSQSALLWFSSEKYATEHKEKNIILILIPVEYLL